MDRGDKGSVAVCRASPYWTADIEGGIDQSRDSEEIRADKKHRITRPGNTEPRPKRHFAFARRRRRGPTPEMEHEDETLTSCVLVEPRVEGGNISEAGLHFIAKHKVSR